MWMFLLVPLIVLLGAYLIKLLVDIVFYDLSLKRTRITNILFRSGGFPSTHSALVASVSTLVGCFEGINSPIFVAIVTLSFLFCYDAMGVRWQVGKQGSLLNILRDKFSLSISPFNERVGHTFWEVAGGVVFGFGVTMLLYYFWLT